MLSPEAISFSEIASHFFVKMAWGIKNKDFGE